MGEPEVLGKQPCQLQLRSVGHALSFKHTGEPELPGKQFCKGQLGPVRHALSFESMDVSFVEVLWMDSVKHGTG